ncbi:DUF6959 family protein [Streptomyces sp. NPDC002324]
MTACSTRTRPSGGRCRVRPSTQRVRPGRVRGGTGRPGGAAPPRTWPAAPRRADQCCRSLSTDGGNDAVVRLPGRRFPGVLMQGDSLPILRSDLAAVVEKRERGDVAEARDSVGLPLAGVRDQCRSHDKEPDPVRLGPALQV